MTTAPDNTELKPAQFFKCLSDETRLQLMLLIQGEGELCVCELTEALGLSQPKISRHLAQLRLCGLLQDERRGHWVFYRLTDTLPEWMTAVLQMTGTNHAADMAAARDRLAKMQDRPGRCC